MGWGFGQIDFKVPMISLTLDYRGGKPVQWKKPSKYSIGGVYSLRKV